MCENKTLLWLDDYRNPFEKDWLKHIPLEKPYDIIWVKDYYEFISYIESNELPYYICFDHDLSDLQAYIAGEPDFLQEQEDVCKEEGIENKLAIKFAEEKSGHDAAKWIVAYCIDNNLELPKWYCQSSNPVGKLNINSTLSNFRKESYD